MSRYVLIITHLCYLLPHMELFVLHHNSFTLILSSLRRRPPNRGEQETLEQKAQRLDQETVQHLKMAAAINHETVELGTATLA